MLTQKQNELLCRVEGEAAMGQMMRRHWLPVCMA
jgi:phthalate 4,5-dioxygenase oxygenase subunit